MARKSRGRSESHEWLAAIQIINRALGDDRLVARREVIAKYARCGPSGRPVFCMPSQAELSGEIDRKQSEAGDGKIIYPDWGAAANAARELEALGEVPQRPYPCRRSRHGHHHLTTSTRRP